MLSILEGMSSLKLKLFPPDILMSDLIMPDMDGIEMISRLREAGWLGPALAIGGYTREEDVHKALAAGFNEHLAKPIDIHELVERVATLSRIKGFALANCFKLR
jgi:CheY-like chemotaxis protein